MSWVFLLLEVLAGAGLLGVGLLVVKPARSTPGYLLAAAGGLVLLGGCCFFGVGRAAQSSIQDGYGSYDAMMAVSAFTTVGSGCADLLIVALVAAAAVTLAKGFEARSDTSA